VAWTPHIKEVCKHSHLSGGWEKPLKYSSSRQRLMEEIFPIRYQAALVKLFWKSATMQNGISEI
jgi:hypothetical protein